MPQIPTDSESIAESEPHHGIHHIGNGLAYIRTAIVNVVFWRAPDGGWVLVDAGVTGSKSAIMMAAKRFVGSDTKPKAIVLTHGHFDHVGTLEDLAQTWDTPIFAHSLEHPYLNGSAAYPDGDPTVGGGLMASLSRYYPTKPIDVSRWLQGLPADGTIPAMPGWRWIHTPGHSPGHVSLFRDSDRCLIAGDAFVTTKQESAYAVMFQTPEMHGPPQYFTIDWEKAKASVGRLADLRPDLVVTGHGRAMHGPQMTTALEELARKFDEVAVPKTGRYVRQPARVEDGTAYVGA